MSKIEEMLKRLCPEGVERRPLAQAVSVKRGVRVVKQQLAETGDYPVYQNCLTAMGYYAESNCSGDTAFVIAAGAAGSVGYCDVDFWAADDCYYMVAPNEINNKFLYYALKSKEPLLLSKVRKASVPRLARDVVESMEIPLPPRPVQDEIVKALDAIDAAVKALEEERAARQEQFEAARERIFSVANDADVVLLSDVIENVSSRGHQINQSEIQENGAFPVVSQSANDVEGYTDKDICVEILPVIVFGDHTCWLKFVDFPFVVGADGTKLLVPKDERTLGVKYLYYALTSIISKVFDGKYRRHYSILLEQRIPIPTVAIQKKIAAQLDAFAAVVAALDEEIAARREQFAGWLEKLMKFDAKEVA